ncbi:MAG: hypothetical protein ACOYNB_11995 [Aquabacterium sp.]|uniref:hypothetical protein n=1 Tax=Aquabacterium sp. TaxID=1872578 RepID=UPI003BCC5FF3
MSIQKAGIAIVVIATVAIAALQSRASFKRVQNLSITKWIDSAGKNQGIHIVNHSGATVTFDLECDIRPRKENAKQTLTVEKISLQPGESRDVQLRNEIGVQLPSHMLPSGSSGAPPSGHPAAGQIVMQTGFVVPNRECVSTWKGPFDIRRPASSIVWSGTQLGTSKIDGWLYTRGRHEPDDWQVKSVKPARHE